jgi:hypothetical protein
LVGLSNFKISDKYMCTDCDESGTALKVYAGGDIAKHAAVEVAYIDFGRAKGTLTGLDLASNQLVPVPAKLRSNAFVVAGVGKWEVYPKLNLAGKAGIAFVRSAIELTTYRVEDRNSRAQPYGGLAIDYEVLKDFRVVGHYDLTKYEVSGEKGTLYQLGLGVQSDF